MKKTMKVCAVLLSLLMFAGCSLFSQNETPVASKTSTSKATRGDLVLGLSADGSITLPVTGLDFAVSGIISKIYVSAGDTVKKGDLLAELDDSDLQLAYKTAQNNLEKALLAYDEAVANAEYNLRTETINLESTQEQLYTTFDEYSYQLSVENAKLALERRKQDYEDTVYANRVADESTRLTLARKEADLAEAKADLAEAEAEQAEPFDEFTYRNNITSAEKTVERMKKTLDEANEELKQIKKDYRNDLYSSDDEVKDAAKEIIAQYETAVYNAQNNYDDAVASLNIANDNLKRDAASHETSEAERIANAVDTARKAVTAAQQAVDDAQTAVNNTFTDNTQKVISARQAIDDAETTLANAQEDLARARSNYQDELRSTQNSYNLQALKLDNMTNADSSIQNALYNIEDARNALESAENDLAKIRITSPIDGEVLNVTKKVGEKVSESENAPGFFMGTDSTSNSFVTIRDMSEIYLSASIPEGDIVGLSVGQKIRVEVDSLDGQVLNATVYSISSIPSRDSSGIITYSVVGILDELNENIRDSMSVFLTFIKREKSNVLLIPNKAVTMEDGQQYVYVQKEDGTLEKRAVTCGLSNGTQTEVTDGLEVGETVVVGKVNL